MCIVNPHVREFLPKAKEAKTKLARKATERCELRDCTARSAALNKVIQCARSYFQDMCVAECLLLFFLTFRTSRTVFLIAYSLKCNSTSSRNTFKTKRAYAR